MKIYTNDKYHFKNDEGYLKILKLLEIKIVETVEDADVICSPGIIFDTSLHPTKKFIFGPHASVLPDKDELLKINANIYNNAIYIQPSKWAADAWIGVNDVIPIKVFPFPVNIELFKPNEDISLNEKTEVFIYYKSRNPQELEFLENFLKNKNISYKIFVHSKRYDEMDYIRTLERAKYGIWLGRHESQGFALEEALSCNVPLLVWDVRSMNQEYGYEYDDIPATCIPYWNSRCGEFFHEKEQLQEMHSLLLENIDKKVYSPRDYIVENMTIEKCSSTFLEIINNIQIKSS
jgi:glycosyltransferase involved in cell wall biosynthesis